MIADDPPALWKTNCAYLFDLSLILASICFKHVLATIYRPVLQYRLSRAFDLRAFVCKGLGRRSLVLRAHAEFPLRQKALADPTNPAHFRALADFYEHHADTVHATLPQFVGFNEAAGHIDHKVPLLWAISEMKKHVTLPSTFVQPADQPVHVRRTTLVGDEYLTLTGEQAAEFEEMMQLKSGPFPAANDAHHFPTSIPSESTKA